MQIKWYREYNMWEDDSIIVNWVKTTTGVPVKTKKFLKILKFHNPMSSLFSTVKDTILVAAGTVESVSL